MDLTSQCNQLDASASRLSAENRNLAALITKLQQDLAIEQQGSKLKQDELERRDAEYYSSLGSYQTEVRFQSNTQFKQPFKATFIVFTSCLQQLRKYPAKTRLTKVSWCRFRGSRWRRGNSAPKSALWKAPKVASERRPQMHLQSSE